jgi:hypothetical protein
MAFTNQTAFDTVVKHLVTQQRRAVHDAGGEDEKARCDYHAPDGTRCAVGVLIPDELYAPSMEGRRIGSTLCGHRARLRGLFDGVHLGLLDALQRAHDRPANWPAGGVPGITRALLRDLHFVAEDCGLDATFLDTITPTVED